MLRRTMMAKLNDAMREFLNGCHYATLATFNAGSSIHLTPVWYLFTDDCLFVATADDLKMKNVLARPQASLVVDSRRQQGAERWVSATGTAEIIRGERSTDINTKILQRYLTAAGHKDPRVGAVFAAAGTATIGLRPQSWRAWDLKRDDEQFFGGLLGQTPERWFLPVE
jgi:PPOX class probable F420-dependent enzyme